MDCSRTQSGPENSPRKHPIEINEELQDIRIQIWHSDLISESNQKLWKTDWHTHTNCEIVVLFRGNERIHVDRDYVISGGTICVIPPLVSHENQPLDDCQQKMSLLVSVTKKRKNIRSHTPEQILYDIFQKIAHGNGVPTFLTDSVQVIADAKKALEAVKSDDPLVSASYRYYLISFVYQVASRMQNRERLRNLPPRTAPAANSDSKGIREQIIEAYLYANCMRNTTLQDLAGYIHLSERQTRRILIDGFGQSFKQQINTMRIHAAQKLLSEGKSINIVSESVGFQSVSGFKKAFRSITGFSISDYMSNLGNATSENSSDGKSIPFPPKQNEKN